MSFFTKPFRTTSRFFNKQAKPLAENFFRKGGGLGKLSTGLRQSSNVLRGVGAGVKSLSQNPLVLAGGTVLGSYLGNPLLGAQIGAGGLALGTGIEEASTLLGGAREITNRNRYMSRNQREDENRAIAGREQRRRDRRVNNELERLLPSVPTAFAEPIYDKPIAQPVNIPDYGNPNIPFFF